jgi:hypothetical protein
MSKGNKKVYINDNYALLLGLDLNDSKRYRLSVDKIKALNELKNNGGICKTSEAVETLPSNIPYYWDKSTKEYSVMVKNPLYKNPSDVNLTEIDFLNIFEGKIEPIKIINGSYPKLQGCIFDRAVFTDVHVGMDVNKDGFSLYDGIWNEEELFKRCDIFVNEIVKHQKSNVLLLHELGDFMDGWDGLTTRGGHKLPQNMDNQKAFDIGLSFKIRMIDALLQYYDTIKVVNICNDNHAGSFGYIVNSAFKTYIELKYPDNVEIINQRKFIDHYIIENRCFILTHGKDDKSLKFGFKPQLDAVQIEKIKNYIDEYKLHQYDIEFSKGDSHQLMFDLTSSTAFEYQNFGAFSPPSDWVKTNFKNTKSSFTTFNYYDKQKTINNYIF